jgi:hypothetical protein
MKFRFVLLLALLAGGAAHAQLKAPPEAGNAPASPGAPSTSVKSPLIEAKEAAAAQKAEAWLKLMDNGDYGKAWDECGALFRNMVTRQQWVEGLPKDRAALGKFKSRKLEDVMYRSSMPGAPEGEYVMTRFFADYEKNPKVEEVVSLMYIDGTWRPIGYGTR